MTKTPDQSPATKSSDKKARSNSSAKMIKLPTPPFSSPTKGKPVKRFKKEQSQKAPHTICFERVGDKQNSYIVYIKRPNNDGGFIQPVDNFLQAETPESDKFKEYANALAPLVSRRINRNNNEPLPEKSERNLTKGKPNYPFRCLYCQKTDEIEHDVHILCVMDVVKDVINNASKYPTNFVTDLRLSNATKEGPRPMDHVITDKGIQTILYRYYFDEHLNEETFDEQDEVCVIPEKITKTFYTNHHDVAHHYFSPHNGTYSAMAQSFGFPVSPEE